MGWLLWGLARRPQLSNNLLLKGGSALRKLYFADTRFSDDLDFTARQSVDGSLFRRELTDLVAEVSSVAGITFVGDRLRVEEKPTPDPDEHSLDGRVYFRGFAGDESLTMRIKFDVSPYERIVLPIQRHPVIHSFPDAAACAASVQGYSLEEILAEKLRSWIQRTRSRDLFDVVKIVQSGRVDISKRAILSAFFQKTVFKEIPFVGRDELLAPEKLNTVASSWLSTIVCPARTIIIASQAVAIFTAFVASLFQPAVLQPLISRAATMSAGVSRIPSSIREALISAGRARHLVRMHYHGKERTIEPYSLKFRVRKQDGRGFEYFWGFDRSSGNTIKCFFVGEIASVIDMGETFLPRYVVEF